MLKKHTIFIVDDSYVFRSLVKKTLHSQNYEVIQEATNGADALMKYKECSPDVVLIDTKMPGMDGFEVILEVKKANPNQKIIAVLVENNHELKEKAMKCGASDIIFKPFQPAFIFTKLENLLINHIASDNTVLTKETTVEKDDCSKEEIITNSVAPINNNAFEEEFGEMVITIANSVEANEEVIEIITPDDQFVFDSNTEAENEKINNLALNALKNPNHIDDLPIQPETPVVAKNSEEIVSIRKPQDYRYKLIEEDSEGANLSPPEVFPKDSDVDGSISSNKTVNIFKKLFNLKNKGGI